MQVSLDNKDAKAIHTNYSSRVGWNEVLSIFQYQEEFDRYNWALLCNDFIVIIILFSGSTGVLPLGLILSSSERTLGTLTVK